LNYGEEEEATFVADLDPVTGKIRGTATRLESSFGSNPAMAWSPDGKVIAAAKRDELVVRSIETGEARSMLKSMRLAGSTMWLRDGKTLLQAVRDSANTIHFDRVDVSTGEFKEVLATGATSNSLESALSPDEKTVYTNTGTGNTNGSRTIAAFDLATGQRREVFTAKDDGLVPGIALSPDGRTIVFKVFYPGKRSEKHLCLIGVDGSNFREIYTDTEAGDGTLRPQMAWTRNGRSILFTRATEDGWRLMRIPVEGGTPEFTGLAGKGTNTNINLNPDGSRIAFNDSVSASNAELWALDNLMSVLKAER
jgi:Tol biopolymer transport system component